MFKFLFGGSDHEISLRERALERERVELERRERLLVDRERLLVDRERLFVDRELSLIERERLLTYQEHGKHQLTDPEHSLTDKKPSPTEDERSFTGRDQGAGEDVAQNISPTPIIHDFHPHPLMANKSKSTRKDYWCASCHKYFQNADFFSCDACNFFMDPKCSSMAPIKCEFGQPHIQHFSHQHPMPLVETFFVDDDEVVCFACQSQCLGAPVYGCEECKYFLHKRCAECPLTEVTHSSHPSHPLSLSIVHEKLVSCKCCERKVSCFILRCNTFQCDWNMCIECFLLPKTLNHDEYYVHSHHPDLTLSMSSTNFTCNLCHLSFKSSSCFKCTTCDFFIDVECALMPPIMLQGQEHFRHFSHPHPMKLVNHKSDEDGFEDCCFACNSPCTSCPSYYACANCKYFLHKICAELPIKVYNPIHQHPNLTLLPNSKLGIESFYCSLCCRKGYGFFFRCGKSCEFKICGRCVFVRPSIKYERHGQHLLSVVEKIHDTNLGCEAYDGYCKLPTTSVELSSTKSSMFRCVDCNFNIHLLCGPLPKTIKCDCHIHLLILVDSVVEDYSDECFCDICENKRDPRICVYYCEECQYVGHVHCLLSKVMSLLTGDLRDVELKTVKIGIDLEKKGLINKALTGKELENQSSMKIFKDIVNRLPEDEQIMLWCHYDWDMSAQLQPLGETGDKAWLQKLSRFTKEYFDKFMDWLNESSYSERALKLNFNNLLGSEIVFVEGYMVPRALANVLVSLLRTHGDISSSSKSTLEVKSVTFSFLCQVFYDMSATSVRNVTKDRLKEWYFYLNYAQRRGFSIELIIDRLKDVVLAFFGLQAAMERKDASDVQRVEANDIKMLQNELENLKSGSFSSFANWGQFTMECLCKALELMDNNVAPIVLTSKMG
ncbi:Phospholipase-like [Trema orientale]|uniref:Phospholipase-like n=1 Tax=Trema orientale TaxID=63057 RepID=A0A2P5F4D6_TREOI|nr:Phospholipase-like [Trema orientale]